MVIANISKVQYATTKTQSKHQTYTDSLKQVKYKNGFLIWWQKAYSNGFDILYTTGLIKRSLSKMILVKIWVLWPLLDWRYT